MIQYVAKELNRIMSLIPETDPSTADYHILLQSLECFAGIAELIEQIVEQTGEEPTYEGKIIKVEFNPEALKQQAEEFPPQDESPFPEPEETEEPEPATTEPPPDIVTVRKAMREAKKRGVDITAVVHSFGATNLTDLPEDKWIELLHELEK